MTQRTDRDSPPEGDPKSEVEKLLSEFLERQERGEAPSFDAYCQEHCAGRPDLEEALRKRYREWESLKGFGARVMGDREIDPGSLARGSRVGDYVLVRRLG